MLAVVLAAAVYWVFSSSLSLVYLTVLPLLWVGMRFGLFGMALAVMLLMAMAWNRTLAGVGPYVPYAPYAPEHHILLMQLYLMAVSVCGMLLAAVATQHRQDQRALQRARIELEIAHSELEQRLCTLLDAIPDEVRLIDVQGRYLMLNRAAQTGGGAGWPLGFIQSGHPVL